MITNTSDLTLTVNRDNGVQTEVYVAPGEALFDRSGLLYQFTLRYRDGSAEHYWLRAGHSRTDDVVDTAVDFLSRFGISILAGKLVFRNQVVTNLAQFLVKTYGADVVKEVVESYHRAHPTYSYFEMITGTRTFQGPIRLQLR